FIDQSVETAARLVVTVRLTAPFELSKESKLIIGQVRHDGLQWFRPKVAHLVRQETAAQRGKDSASMTHVRGRDYSKLTRNIKRIPMRFRHVLLQRSLGKSSAKQTGVLSGVEQQPAGHGSRGESGSTPSANRVSHAAAQHGLLVLLS